MGSIVFSDIDLDMGAPRYRLRQRYSLPDGLAVSRSLKAKENKMTGIVAALRWVARLDGIAALVLGIILWIGSPELLKIHILTGFVMSITMLLLGLFGFFARVKPALPIVATAWALLLPYVGFVQLKLFSGASHVIQIIHVLIGVCAMGIAEAIATKIKRQARP